MITTQIQVLSMNLKCPLHSDTIVKIPSLQNLISSITLHATEPRASKNPQPYIVKSGTATIMLIKYVLKLRLAAKVTVFN